MLWLETRILSFCALSSQNRYSDTFVERGSFFFQIACLVVREITKKLKHFWEPYYDTALAHSPFFKLKRTTYFGNQKPRGDPSTNEPTNYSSGYGNPNANEAQGSNASSSNVGSFGARRRDSDWAQQWGVGQHGAATRRTTNVRDPSVPPAREGMRVYKTIRCKYHYGGRICKHGAHCSFAHADSELRG